MKSLRLEETSCDHALPLLKQDQAELISQDCVQEGFEYSQGRSKDIQAARAAHIPDSAP